MQVGFEITYISAILLGVMIAFLISFCLVLLWNREQSPKKRDWLKEIDAQVEFKSTHVVDNRTDKIYYKHDNSE
ncbi:MAG: hypothetical protein E7291_09225 [Lachnospiraceae bacterium]|nr:hypothetical protein [Lachnospiraceae bacterium]